MVLTIQTSEWLYRRKSDGGDGQSEDHDRDPQRNDCPHLRSFHRLAYIVIHVEPRSSTERPCKGRPGDWTITSLKEVRLHNVALFRNALLNVPRSMFAAAYNRF